MHPRHQGIRSTALWFYLITSWARPAATATAFRSCSWSFVRRDGCSFTIFSPFSVTGGSGWSGRMISVFSTPAWLWCLLTRTYRNQLKSVIHENKKKKKTQKKPKINIAPSVDKGRILIRILVTCPHLQRNKNDKREHLRVCLGELVHILKEWHWCLASGSGPVRLNIPESVPAYHF